MRGRNGGLRSAALLFAAASAFGSVVERPGPAAVVEVDAEHRSTAERTRLPPPRRLILKLRPAADVCIGCRLANGQRLGPLVPGSRLDELFAAHGIRAARRLRRHPPSVGRAPLPTRFPQRARRAPAGAPAPDFDRTWVVDTPRRGNLNAIARAIAADPAVEYCEPDRVAEVAFVPNDPFLASSGSWGQPFDDLWGIERIGAPAAWDVTRGAGVVIAIVDTGIDAAHPDIAANVWTNPGEIAGNAVDDDFNGFVDDVRGWDFADDDADPTDDHLHGTHVAGTVAAVGDNGAGVVGVAYESRVMAVRGLGTGGFGYSSDLAEAILYAVDNGADVINASWGSASPSQTISDAIAAAHAAGVVFVAAAGNATADTAQFFPAADPNAITVAAFTHTDARAGFSNFGLKLDVGAPGGGDGPPPNSFSSDSILSALSTALHPDNVPVGALVLESGGVSYLRIAGTSMAAPHVSGTAALALAANPSLSVEQVRQLLRSTAIDLPPAGPDPDSGYGIVNAAAVVTAPAPLEAHIAYPAGVRLLGPTAVDVTGSASGPGFVSYSVDYRAASDPTGWVPIAGPIGTAVADGVLATWDASGLTDGEYVVRLRVDRIGAVFMDQAAFGVRNAQIESPEQLAALRPDGPIEIRGTAAGGGFVGYTVQIRRPALHGNSWHTDGVTLAGSPGTPVRHDLLATLDVSSLANADRFDFRLTVTSGSGTTMVERLGVVVDPALRAGWPQNVLANGDREYLTVADLDGIGTRSILVGSGSEVVVFEADGSARPGWPQSIVVDGPNAFTRSSPLVADVLGDGRPEVIATNGDYLIVWSADGVRQAPFPVYVSVLAFGFNQWITAGDVDGDGKDEIVCSTNVGLQVIRGDGTVLPGWSSSAVDGRMAAVGQILGDPRAEVARWWAADAHLSGRGYLEVRSGGGSVVASRKMKGSTFTRVDIADMDGDGRGDLVVPAQKPNTTSYKLKVAAVNAEARPVRLRKPKVRGPFGRPSLMLAFSDLDRDGRAEAWQYARGVRSAYFDEEPGYFAPWQSPLDPTPFLPVSHRLFLYPLYKDGPFGVAIGDVDGDGVQELVGGMVGNGCAGALDACTADSAPGAPVRRALVVQRADGTLVPGFPRPVPQLFLEADGGLTGVVSSFGDDQFAATPAIADLDGDGLKELVWYDPEASRIFVWNVPGTPGPLLADWPMYAHDPKHSNTLPPTVP
jgi:subtilisin family serine protease